MHEVPKDDIAPEQPATDVLEQRQDDAEHGEPGPTGETPVEAAEADAAEQSRALDPDDDRDTYR
ncbi:hypothetical protein EV193_107245 [Herbihabitans rhizosphaerae]|uniref:Uncharacterized protein n=1 Tax=Herbihabitans rhizosphaerae TaxID=1872711 RepID=A0A4Q7KK28_9PSEU|nr:hypothetical protein [Herbihabitans rhizosphaerae]RZS36564.1 hypothetical protein EV193_107245 [Herbihabitans rhizosphaerae]